MLYVVTSLIFVEQKEEVWAPSNVVIFEIDVKN